MEQEEQELLQALDACKKEEQELLVRSLIFAGHLAVSVVLIFGCFWLFMNPQLFHSKKAPRCSPILRPNLLGKDSRKNSCSARPVPSSSTSSVNAIGHEPPGGGFLDPCGAISAGPSRYGRGEELQTGI